MKNKFYASCPCCGEKLRVDVALRRLETADSSKRDPSLLESPDAVLEQDEGRRKESFDKAFDEETTKDKRSLDDLL